MLQKTVKILNFNTGRKLCSSRVFKFAAVLTLGFNLLQPFSALADDVTINDANNTQNPAEQNVQAGATNDVPVVTQATYSTSTPADLPVNVDQALSSPENIIPDSASTSTPDSTTPNSESTTTPDGVTNPESTTTPETPLPLPGLEIASSTVSSTSTIEIINTNDLNVKTVSTSTANTGLNNITAGDDIKYATTTTGDVNVYANVLTVANINLINSQIVEMNDSFNKLAADLYFNQTELSPGERTQDLISPICSSGQVSCQSITTFKLTNKNTANVENDVTLSGNSGGNKLETNGNMGDIRDSAITTGNVNAVVNVLNIVNANALNSRWTIVTFNVFGGWKGDLVMPSELYFSDAMSIGTEGSSDISQVTKVILDVNNTNQSTISNTVTVNTDTGSNILQTVPDAHGNDGDIKDSSIATGDSLAQSNTQNVTNLTVYNSRWFLGLINIMGDWSGHVYSLPDSVAVDYQPTGFSFVSSSDPAVQAQLIAQLEAPIATTTPLTGENPLTPENSPADSQNQQVITTPQADSTTDGASGSGSASTTTETTVEISNTNRAEINNHVTIDATTGQNSMVATGDIRNNSITTGNATALANILNFANVNLINADLYIGLVNIFGDWDGNIVFGYPDLSVDQSVAPSAIPGQANSQANVNISFANQANASIADCRFEWKYNPTLFSVNTIQSPYTYQEATPGDILFVLGKVTPNQTGSISIKLNTLLNQPGGMEDKFFASIFGNGPEKNMDNNQNILTVLTANSGPIINSPPSPTPTPTPTPPPATGGGGSSGSSGPSASSGSSSGGGASTQTSNSSGLDIGIYPNVLRIYKTNTAHGSLKPGDKIHFTITVDNDGNNTLHALVVTDTLRGPDGAVINTQSYNIDQMLTRQETTFNYDLVLADTAGAGSYNNSVYAQGLNDSLQTVRSQSTALSSFTVANIGQQTNGQNKAFKIEQLDSKLPTDTASSTPDSVTASSTLDSLGKVVNNNGQVLGQTCVQPSFKINLQQGSKSNDVKALQIYLNGNGFILAKSGAGSPRAETAAFGPLLKIALTNFQKKNGLKERGAFGAETRTKLNNILNTSGSIFCLPPVPAVKVSVKKISVSPPPVLKPVINKNSSKPQVPTKPLASNTMAPSESALLTVTPSPKLSNPGFWSGLAKHIW